MAIRFTEYMEHKSGEIALYIVQEDIDLDKVGFKIFIKGEGNVVFALYKMGGEQWKLIPHNVPPMVRDIQEQLIVLLENKLSVSQRYEPLVRRSR